MNSYKCNIHETFLRKNIQKKKKKLKIYFPKRNFKHKNVINVSSKAE